MAEDQKTEELIIPKINFSEWQSHLIPTIKKDDSSLEESIVNTVSRFERLLPNIKKSSKLLFLYEGNTFLPVYIYSKHKCQVTIITKDEKGQKEVLKQLEKYKVADSIKVEVRDYQMTQFDYDFFDMAWSVNSTKYVDDLMPFLREIRRILTPQGRFVLFEMTSEDEEVMSTRSIYSTKEILKQANKADLEKVYEKDFIKESTKYSQLLEEHVKKDEIAAVKKLAQDIEKENLVWTLFQFQKRNA